MRRIQPRVVDRFPMPTTSEVLLALSHAIESRDDHRARIYRAVIARRLLHAQREARA